MDAGAAVSLRTQLHVSGVLHTLFIGRPSHFLFCRIHRKMSFASPRPQWLHVEAAERQQGLGALAFLHFTPTVFFSNEKLPKRISSIHMVLMHHPAFQRMLRLQSWGRALISGPKSASETSSGSCGGRTSKPGHQSGTAGLKQHRDTDTHTPGREGSWVEGLLASSTGSNTTTSFTYIVISFFCQPVKIRVMNPCESGSGSQSCMWWQWGSMQLYHLDLLPLAFLAVFCFRKCLFCQYLEAFCQVCAAHFYGATAWHKEHWCQISPELMCLQVIQNNWLYPEMRFSHRAKRRIKGSITSHRGCPVLC